MKDKTILFDLDGTLVDSTCAILEAFEVALKGSKAHFNGEQIKAMIGFPLDIMFARLGFEGGEIALCIDKYREHYGKIYLAQSKLLPKVREALNLASEFATLAVVTTKGSPFSKALLAHLGILPLFDALVGKDDVSEPKPSAEPILKVLSLLNKSKENAFMVGDTHLDIKAAQNAGISCVALSCGYESVDSLKSCGVTVRANAYEAVEYIKNL